MTDNLARTIAALRESAADIAGQLVAVKAANILALCDAAERGMRAPPREPIADYDRCPICGPTMVSENCCARHGPTADLWGAYLCGWNARNDAAPINEGGQDAADRKDAEATAVASTHPVPPSPAAPAPLWTHPAPDAAPPSTLSPSYTMTIGAAAPAPDLREKIMVAMSPIARDHAHWSHWPGTCAFADAALSVVQPLLAAQAAQIAELTRERDEARAQIEAHKIRPRGKSDSPAIFNAVQRAERAEAECERLRALLERWRAEYGGSTFPKTGKPCNKRLDDDTDAAIDAARGEGE